MQTEMQTYIVYAHMCVCVQVSMWTLYREGGGERGREERERGREVGEGERQRGREGEGERERGTNLHTRMNVRSCGHSR